MSLSVCVLNYNGSSYLEECLDSIVNQIEDGTELILVDNNSSDESWKIGEKYDFKVIHADNQHKFITGINTALKSFSGDKILFTQADVRFEKGSIESLVNSCKQWSIVQPVFIHNGKVDNAGMRWVWPGYGLGTRSLKGGNFQVPTEICTDITFITTSKVIEFVGLYDENFNPAYYEDVDWALRSRKLGVLHLVDNAAIVYHRHNESFSAIYSKKAISDICRKNRRYLINKHYKGFDRMLRLTVSSCLDVAKKTFDVIHEWWVTSHN